MVSLKIEYVISKKLQDQIFIEKGEKIATTQEITIDADKLSVAARKMWTELYGTRETVKPKKYALRTGIFSENSISDNPPSIEYDTDFESAQVLTDVDFEMLVKTIYAQYNEIAAQLPTANANYKILLAKIKAAEEAKQAEKIAKEKTEEYLKLRQQNKAWIQQLKTKISIETSQQTEIERFKKAFELDNAELQKSNSISKPFISLKASVPVFINAGEKTLIIRNYNFTDTDTGHNSECYSEGIFSELSHKIADTLAEIFAGKKVIVNDYDNRDTYLMVKIESDSIEIAKADMNSNDDC
jgi:hypothetical protein